LFKILETTILKNEIILIGQAARVFAY
jgi:hypothetical protein